MACHNNHAAVGTTGNEYTTWIDKDRKHAGAYQVLFSERSRHIQKNLERLADIKHAHPEKNVLCLRCHVHPHVTAPATAEDIRFLADGVSCEVCHGAAEKWLTRHYREPWQQYSTAEKARWGMYDTSSILGRARLCLDCHVGSPANDVNHDLLAAGHPRLKFEFAAFHANMPHHWGDARDKNPAVDTRARPDFEARAWVIGQSLTAEASLKLLSTRAADEKSPWPEFANYDCYTCHHDLQARSPRQDAAGQMPFNTWYTAMTAQAVAAGGMDASLLKKLKKLIGEINKEMEKPVPARKVVRMNAHKAAGLLSEYASRLDNSVPLDETFRRVLQLDRKEMGRSWDQTAQVWLALAALHNAWADTHPEKTSPAKSILEETGTRLLFPRGFESPAGFDPEPIQIRWKELSALAPR
jgi:hypothetical protein